MASTNGMQQIIEYCFSSLTHEDVLNITQNKLSITTMRNVAKLHCFLVKIFHMLLLTLKQVIVTTHQLTMASCGTCQILHN